MSKTKIVEVYDLKDPFFGRNVTREGSEIARVFAYYAKQNYEDHLGWKTFSYRRWSGYEEDVKIRISKVLLDKTYSCYVEMEATSDILDHYWPSPFDLIDNKYIGSTSSNFIPEEFHEVLYD